MLIEWLMRFAALCFGFFALGHSLGHLGRLKIADPKAQEVIALMRSYRYNLFGKMRSYDENYEGMSLNLIATLVFFAVVLAVASFFLASSLEFIRVFIVGAFFISTIFCITSFRYFFVVPAVTCLLASLSLLAAFILIQ